MDVRESIKNTVRNTPLLSSLPDDIFKEICTECRMIQLKKRELLFSEGDSVEGFYCVAVGRVKIFKLSPEGKEHVLHFAEKGQTFGEAAIFGFPGYPASAEAIEDSTVVRISKDRFIDVITRDQATCLKLFADLATWIRRLSDIITALSFKDVEERLIAYIGHECAARLGNVEAGKPFDLGVEKALLASYLGTIPETLSRTIRKLQDNGIVEIRGSEVKIINADKVSDVIAMDME